MVMDLPRLLVLDDDPYTRTALRTLFGRRGWRVDLAATVAEGLALARVDPVPHCALLDLNLPDGDGETVLIEIRRRDPRIPVAICSGTDDPARLARVRDLRPHLLLWKPIEMAPLYHLCDAALALRA